MSGIMTNAITSRRPQPIFPRLQGSNKAPLVTVWFDGGCPLCQREIALMRRLDGRGAIDFVDLSDGGSVCPIDRAELLARFHAREREGPLVSGAAAFAAMWRAIPVLAWAGHAARLPLLGWLLERGYRVWLQLRPSLQRALRNRAVSVDASPPPRL
jgi:predicted DCC family thiol-disulfide oxidoreductase YuxK